MRLLLLVLLAFSTFSAPLWAEGREVIGVGRLFTNDYFGDGHDRWRTGSSVVSVVTGREDYTGLEGFGDLIEYRIGGQIISGTRGSGAPGDRPYVGAISLGVHTHFDFGGTDLSMGGEVMAIGPQTGLSDFQRKFHNKFDIPLPPHVDQQLGNVFFFNSTFEASRDVMLSDRVMLRPFVEGLAGVEDLVRVGGDVVIGAQPHDDMMLRDVVTGQLYRATQSPKSGLTFTFGGDLASVFGSAYLPEDQGYVVSETRARARAGVLFNLGRDKTLFYGATYLSEEFEGQGEGQVVGSLRLNFNF
ncbi:lipid A-modifier LpxR family protein [Yoonia sp. MH D7]